MLFSLLIESYYQPTASTYITELPADEKAEGFQVVGSSPCITGAALLVLVAPVSQ
jgi:hypothetical protein|tara:strand:- start:3019 stop:3183 length:165 start_codon:yes stop_codon:yes gene_type:complete